jgi:hypothetical protein
MKGIYLTLEGKQEIEAEMRELMTDIGNLTTSFLKEFDESCKKVIIEKRIKLNSFHKFNLYYGELKVVNTSNYECY